MAAIYTCWVWRQRAQVHYQGACGSCPSSISGTLAGIEGLVRQIDPALEVIAV
jgi:Fe-S cluster biogenesis protein NfuA